MDEIVHLRQVQGRQVGRLYIKRLLRHAGSEDLHVRISIFNVHEVQRFKHGCKLFCKKFCILLADTEDRHVADVAEDGVARRLFYLAEELVRHGERELIFARLREDAGNRVGRHILELIDIEVERRIRRAWIIGARKRRHKELPDDDESEEVRIFLPQATLREVDEEYLLSVHHFAELK